MWPIATDGVTWSVSLSVGWPSAMTVSTAKMAEPTEMPFEMWTWSAQGNHD